MNRYLLSLIVALVLAVPVILTAGTEHDEDHSGEPGLQESLDQHCEGDEHLDELVVELTPQAVAMAGISISKVSRGRIGETIDLPGEVGFNEDRLVHIAPRFAGIALQTMYRVGDYVDAGSVVATVESNESMNSYSITAPISGWVIERHICPGEFVSEENSIYVIADLSQVWVNLAVFPKDADRVTKGRDVQIKAIGSDIRSNGTIEYVTPIMDVHTRSLTARVVLPNPDNTWRPGTFVQGTVVAQAGDEGLVVEKNAVQYLDEESVVFVVDGLNRYRPVEVTTGESDIHHVRILAGLEEGTEYVADGAFELKARIVTSSLDGHAGHGP